MDDLGPLSERELEVLKLVATGATNQQIARALVISPNTVKVHLRNIFEKLGVQSRTEATMEAVRRGWVPVSTAVLAVDAVKPAAEPALAEVPVRRRAPVAGWQRIYMTVALAAVILAALAPGWWPGRARSAPATAFSDLGRPQTAAAPRPDVARWTANAALPEARSRLALAADAEKLYVIGGEAASGVTGAVAIYDPVSNGWLPGPDKPTPVSNIAAIYLDGRIYVPGGSTAVGGVTDVLEVYDPQAAAWEARARLPAPVAGYSLAALNGRLHLFGGWDGQAYRSEAYVYDPAADRWGATRPMPAPRAFSAAGTLDGRIYVVGGYDGRRELASVAVYDPAAEGTPAGPWTAKAALSQPRAGLGLAVIGARLYAVGGGWNTTLAFNEQYDAAIDAWSQIGTPVADQWRNLGLVAFDQKLYAVGGWSGRYLDVNEQYQALIRQLLPLGSKGG